MSKKEKKPFLWVDRAQATDRLTGTYVLFDGVPYYIREVVSGGAYVIPYTERGGQPMIQVALDDPRWRDFRELPPMGWTNLVNTGNNKGRPRAAYLERLPYRGRRHGLSNENVSVRTAKSSNPADLSFNTVVQDPGFSATIRNEYPSFEEALEKLPRDSSAAVSRKYALYKDGEDLFWLFVRYKRVGFLSKGTLFVKPSLIFHRDEILEDRLLPIEIKEL